MHRNHLLNLLEQYKPLDSRDAECRGRFVEFVDAHTDCFERSLEVGHMTASAWLLDSMGRKVLLTHHRKLDCWLQVGGHADGHCNVVDVALREAREESGIQDICLLDAMIFDLDIHTIPRFKDVPAHEHYDVRFLLQAADDKLTISDESHDLGWFDAAQLASMNLDDSIMRMREKWLAREWVTKTIVKPH